MLGYVVGVGVQVLAAGHRRGGLCAREERPGLPCARHSRFQPAPMDPPQGTAEPLSQDGGVSGKVCVRKGRKHCAAIEREVRKKCARNSPADSKVSEEGGGGGAPGVGAEIPLQTLEETMVGMGKV